MSLLRPSTEDHSFSTNAA